MIAPPLFRPGHPHLGRRLPLHPHPHSGIAPHLLPPPRTLQFPHRRRGPQTGTLLSRLRIARDRASCQRPHRARLFCRGGRPYLIITGDWRGGVSSVSSPDSSSFSPSARRGISSPAWPIPTTATPSATYPPRPRPWILLLLLHQRTLPPLSRHTAIPTTTTASPGRLLAGQLIWLFPGAFSSPWSCAAPGAIATSSVPTCATTPPTPSSSSIQSVRV